MMKKSVIFSIVCLSLIILTSFGFSSSKTVNDNFVPVEKGKTYKIFVSNGQNSEITILEEPKGNWVKVDMKRYGVQYINLDLVLTVSAE